MTSEQTIERHVLVFTVWVTLGTLGLCLVLQGLVDDQLVLGLAGSIMLAFGFIAHLIINSVFKSDFSVGEVAFGTAFITLTALFVVAGWVGGRPTITGQRITAVLMGVLVLGVIVYLTVKFGVRGLFSRFHSRHRVEQDEL